MSRISKTFDIAGADIVDSWEDASIGNDRLPDEPSYRGSINMALLVAFALPHRSAQLRMLLLFFICAAVQLCFAVHLLGIVGVPDLTQELVLRMWAWMTSVDPVEGGGTCVLGHRHTIACHECAAGNAELASRYGIQGFWSWHADHMEIYLQYGKRGLVLGLCTYFVLATYLVRELTILAKFACVLIVPSNGTWLSGAHCYEFRAREARGELLCLSWAAKLCAVLILAVRLIIVGGVARFGLLTIAYTIEFRDMLLDLCILVFVLRFDEIFHSAFVPPWLQLASRALELRTAFPNYLDDTIHPVHQVLQSQTFAGACALGYVAFASRKFANDLFLSQEISDLCVVACSMACPAVGPVQQDR